MSKAMILAAGRGERLSPLTDTIPKPLLAVAGKPLIVHNIEKLAAIGIKNIVINVSYLASQICQFLGDGKQFGVNIQYSFEPERLDTGGGVFQALPLLGTEPFLVVSSDIYTDYPFEQLLARREIMHDENKLAHLILAPNPDFHQAGDYDLDKQGLLINTPKYTFASFAVLHPSLFQHCKPGKFSYIPLINAGITHQQVTGELYKGPWYNVGTSKELESLRHYLKITKPL